MSNILHFTVSLPTDEGYIGRECNNRECSRYFRIHGDDIQKRMFCPYCGEQFGKEEFYTKSQLDYTRRVREEKALKYMHDEFNKMLHKTLGRSSGNSSFKFKVTTQPYRERSISPTYKEHKVDSALTCHECGIRFQVDGIFGFCPKCRAEHLRIYDANLAIIRQEVEKGSNPDRSLRRAYWDLVSTFELLCKRRAKRVTTTIGRFQNLTATQEFFLTHTQTDIFSELTPDDFLQLRRVFQKRHLSTHGTETIDDKYIKGVPEDASLRGAIPQLSMSEFDAAANAVRKVLDRVVKATEPFRH
jgi:rRNA maturation endonuclease Nob1